MTWFRQSSLQKGMSQPGHTTVVAGRGTDLYTVPAVPAPHYFDPRLASITSAPSTHLATLPTRASVRVCSSQTSLW